QIQETVEHYIRLHPALDLVLRPFFHNAVPGFMQALRLTGAYVSGSVALAYFTRNISRDQVGDLDIYVTPFGMSVLIHFFHSQGYHFEPLPWQTAHSVDVDPIEVDYNLYRPYLGTAIMAVFNFVNADDERVQLIVVDTCPAAAVLGHHSMVVINYFDGSFAVSCYPILTFKM
ncbi:hypothetical protein BDZ89DRAFT_941586, partial [Hymenopellis radicata]